MFSARASEAPCGRSWNGWRKRRRLRFGCVPAGSGRNCRIPFSRPASDLHFTARAYDRILKVARTIADLAGRDQLEAEDVSEAIQYRTLDRNLWV